MMMRRIAIALGVVAVGALGAALFAPARAWAYFEMNITARVTAPQNSGCIQFASSLHHGGGTNPMTMIANAVTSGLVAVPLAAAANGKICNGITNPDYIKQIRGRVSMSLIKRIAAGTNGRKDTYDYCRIEVRSVTPWSDEIDVSQEYSVPPCGPGYYAEIACLDSVQTRIILPSWGFSATGSFTTVDIRRDCNISPKWHPAIGTGNGSPPDLNI